MMKSLFQRIIPACMGVCSAAFPGLCSADSFSLTAVPAPDSQPWRGPAKFAATHADGQATTIAAQAALNYTTSAWAWGQNSVWQAHFSPYLARNTALSKKQDNHGLSANIAGSIGDLTEQTFGLLAQVGLAGRRDRVLNNTAYTITADFSPVSVKYPIGGSGKPAGSGYFFVPTIGIYSDRIVQIDGGLGKGTVQGIRAQLDVHWYAAKTILVKASGQLQHDTSASVDRVKENRRLYTAGVSYLFYDERAAKSGTWRPSISLERVYGADLLQGLEKQGFTQLAFKLAY